MKFIPLSALAASLASNLAHAQMASPSSFVERSLATSAIDSCFAFAV
jgi:hypothetical protein